MDLLYLEARDGEGGRQRAHVCWFIAQTLATGRTGTGEDQPPRTPASLPLLLAGTQLLACLLLGQALAESGCWDLNQALSMGEGIPGSALTSVLNTCARLPASWGGGLGVCPPWAPEGHMLVHCRCSINHLLCEEGRQEPPLLQLPTVNQSLLKSLNLSPLLNSHPPVRAGQP